MTKSPQKQSSIQWVGLIPIGLFAFLVGVFLAPSLFREDPDALPSQFVGTQAPPVRSIALSDKPVFTDQDLRNDEVVLVNFWASWCVPCRAEHPRLEELNQEGLTIFGVNYRDQPEAGLRFLEELGDPYRAIVADQEARMGIDWGLSGVPETFVIAGDGTVIYRHAGPLTVQIVAEKIKPIIQDTKP